MVGGDIALQELTTEGLAIVEAGETITQSTPLIAQGINGLTQQVGGVLPTLSRCISNPSACKALLAGGGAAISALFGGGAAVVELVHGQQSADLLANGSPEDNTSSTSSSSAAPSSTSASSCPLVTDNPDEDEGEDGEATPNTASTPTPSETPPPPPPPPAPIPYREYWPGFYMKCPGDDDCDRKWFIKYNEKPGKSDILHEAIEEQTWDPCKDWESYVAVSDSIDYHNTPPWASGEFPAFKEDPNSPKCTYKQDKIYEAGVFECGGDIKVECITDRTPTLVCDDGPGTQDFPSDAAEEIEGALDEFFGTTPPGFDNWLGQAKCAITNANKFDFFGDDDS